jgi:methionyl aminopeptidase
MIHLKTIEQIELIRKSGQLASRALDLVDEIIKPGITTKEIDTQLHKFITKNGGVPATLGYCGAWGNVPFPASCCISINNEVVHGIPGKRQIKDGDLVKVDVTTNLDGYFGDTARTYLVGKVEKTAKLLAQTTKEALDLGIREVKNGARVGNIGQVIQDHVEAKGFSVVRDFTGHGVGLAIHELLPVIYHYGRRDRGLRMKSGMVFTIEPMINEGHYQTMLLSDGWTAVTTDGKLSAQFEHTLLVTDDGADILTLS